MPRRLFPLRTEIRTRPGHGAHAVALRTDRAHEPAPFGRIPGFTGVICTFLVRRLRALTLRKPARDLTSPEGAHRVESSAEERPGRRAGSRPCRRRRSPRCRASSTLARDETPRYGRRRDPGDQPAGTGASADTSRTSGLGCGWFCEDVTSWFRGWRHPKVPVPVESFSSSRHKGAAGDGLCASRLVRTAGRTDGTDSARSALPHQGRAPGAVRLPHHGPGAWPARRACPPQRHRRARDVPSGQGLRR